MKTKEELNTLKAEIESLSKKLTGLTDEELAQVAGGIDLGPVEAVLKSGLNNLRFDKEPRCPIDTLK